MEHVPHLPTLQAIYAQTHVSYRGDDDHLYSGVGDRIVNVECHTYPEENHQRLSPLRVALSTWNSPVAVQLRSRAIIAACQSQPTSDRVVLPSDRADIGSATSIRVLDSTLGLCEVDPSESAALIRSEGVLVVGGDSFDTIVSKCGHIQHGIESRMPYEMYTTDLDMSSSAPTDGSFMFDLSLFNAEMYSGDAVDQVMPGAQAPIAVDAARALPPFDPPSGKLALAEHFALPPSGAYPGHD
ncbi:hypothetical protein EWM64_g354 [Hericium alpestre]|uniref:DUF7928 domain-containing protein n=1 Tax=Hericium alpestre TaxID=135208 RepID=A0A4Z0ABF1_9AGAM|nr:hypothetical protein EWM64_g354 [Hericium alpestre]